MDDQLRGAARSSTLPLKRAWTGKEPPTINTILPGGIEYQSAKKGETNYFSMLFRGATENCHFFLVGIDEYWLFDLFGHPDVW